MEQEYRWEFITLKELQVGDFIKYKMPGDVYVTGLVKSLVPFELKVRLLKGGRLSPLMIVKKKAPLLGKSFLVRRQGATSENVQSNVPALAPTMDKDYAAKITRTLNHGRNT